MFKFLELFCIRLGRYILDPVKHIIGPLARISSQFAFTCSKLTVETLEQGVKYVQS